MTRRVPLVLAALCASAVLAGCGSEGNEVKGQSAAVDKGAQLFADRCAGCHTLDVVGAQGGATKVHDMERVDGPNFNVRKECTDDVLRAIRQGGFSGAIMPENIVVGEDAEAVAAFLEQYSGTEAPKAAGATPITCS
jgi:mono/diheme cytochrome c family protein